MAVTAPPVRPVRPVPQVITDTVVKPRQTKRWVEWVTTTDHKKIGIMYLVLTFVFFLLGGIEALLMRVQLSVPNSTFAACARSTARAVRNRAPCRPSNRTAMTFGATRSTPPRTSLT